MNKKCTTLITVTLLCASASAWSATDLTYCLQLKSNADIARCAGETAAGSKGVPMSQDQMEKMLSQERPMAPAAAPATPAPATPAPATPAAATPAAATDSTEQNAAPQN